MKTFIQHDFSNSITQHNDNDKFRTYSPTADSTIRYPSVTSIVGILNKDSLDQWKSRVGEAEANRISRQAALRGSYIHSLCEHYLYGISEVKCHLVHQTMFNSLIPELDKIDNIHAIEQKMLSNRIQVAGTVDCIGEYDGVLSIIDFKTSRKLKRHDWIYNYFMQESAYSFMFYETTGLVANQLVTIVAIDDESKAQVFIEPTKPWLKQFIDVRAMFREHYGL